MKTQNNKPIVIFDFNRTLYEPESGSLLPGAQELLKALSTLGVRMFLVSKLEKGREEIVDAVGIRSYFEDIKFVNSKSPEVFKEISQQAGIDVKDVYIVGDYLHEEIRHANRCGAKTIWLRRGRFAHLQPETEHDVPWHTVEHLSEVLPLINQ